MNSSKKLLIFLIIINTVGCANTKIERQSSQSNVIMEDVIVERTVMRTTKQNPKPKNDQVYDHDAVFLRSFTAVLPFLLTPSMGK